MILCSCGNPIEYFIAVASQERRGRYTILSNGSYFACGNCCKKIVKSWQDHNQGRIEPYTIETAKISVTADTKRDFKKRALPQIISRFKLFNWYVPKTDVHRALANTIKG